VPDRPSRTPIGRQRLIVANAVFLVVAWGVFVLAGARSNVQGALENAAYGTIILFFVAIVVQLLVVMWFERRR
jgi:FtsH-binding integral membrane protein